MDFERDYLVPLPSQDLQSWVKAPAEYADAAAMSRALLTELPGASIGKTSPEDAHPKLVIVQCLAKYWTEHSARNGLPSWAAALTIHKEQQRGPA